MLGIEKEILNYNHEHSLNFFDGWIMSQMDIGGVLLASEVARGRVVTVTVDKMTFVRPVHVGDTICVHAKVVRIGNSSMDVKLTKLRLKPTSCEEHGYLFSGNELGCNFCSSITDAPGGRLSESWTLKGEVTGKFSKACPPMP